MNRFAPALGALLLLAACAQVKEPQGGPKDTVAPQLTGSEPANGATHFSGSRIVLHFDERVRLDRVAERLLVSPPLAKRPDVQVRGTRDVVIGLNAPLAANTTYTFNIGEAVTDLSEGNPAAGLAFVVSTGAYLDSLSVHGRVVQAATGLPAADVAVILQDAKDTGDIRTMPPLYFTRSGTDGRFSLAHLRGGPMRLYALRDRNGNYRYDLPNEEVAFLDSVIDPRNPAPHTLFLFMPRPEKQLVTAAKVLPERGWQLTFAKPAKEVTLLSLDREGGRLHWWPEWSAGRDTATFWPSDTTLLNGQRFLVREDSTVLDTLAYRAMAAMPFNLTVSAVQDPVTGDWRLESTRPVERLNLDHVRLRMDTVAVPLTVRPDSIHGRTLGLGVKPPPGRAYELTLFPKAMMAVMGGTNDTTKLTLGAVEPRTLGKLKVDLAADSGTVLPGPLVLQLVNAQGRTMREARIPALPATVHWANLVPASYTLRLFQDLNGDGRWTTGSYLRHLQPERIFLDPGPVVVRAGWSVERSWALGDRP